MTRAFYSRKTCFWEFWKSTFSRITFFFVDVGKSGQSKVCSASDARNFATKFVGIEVLWPHKNPKSNYTAARTPCWLLGAIAFLAGLIELILCGIRSEIVRGCALYRHFFDPGPPWPVMARQTQNQSFLFFLDFSANKKYVNVKIGEG